MKMQKSERGAAAVEFALIAPVLVLMVLGITEFGRAYYFQTTLSQAAREGVRVKAIRDDSSAAIAATRAAASNLTLNSIAVTTTQGGACTVTGTAPVPTATVEVTYTLPFLTGMFGTGVTLTGKGVMRCNG